MIALWCHLFFCCDSLKALDPIGLKFDAVCYTARFFFKKFLLKSVWLDGKSLKM